MWVFVFAVGGLTPPTNSLGDGGGWGGSLDRAGILKTRTLSPQWSAGQVLVRSSASGHYGLLFAIFITCGPQDRLGPEPAPAHKATPHGFSTRASSPARPANRDDAHGVWIETTPRQEGQ